MNRLRGLMAEHRVTQTDLASILEISNVAFNQKLNGKRDFKQSELVKLADYFKVSIDELVR